MTHISLTTAVALLFALGAGACSDSMPSEPAPDHLREEFADFPEIRVRQHLSVGDKVHALRLARITRSPQDLTSRIEALAEVFGETSAVFPSSWSEASLDRPLRPSADGRFREPSDLRVSYFPHRDYLELTASIDPAIDPSAIPPSNEDFARRYAANILSELKARQLVPEGDYGVVRAGRTTVVAEGAPPIAKTYIFDLMRFIDGIAVRNTAVEIELDRSYDLVRLAVADVEVVETLPVSLVERPSAQVEAEFRNKLEAAVRTDIPSARVSISPGLPAYELGLEAQSGVVNPEMVYRWNTSQDGGPVSRSNISTLGLSTNDVIRHVFPPETPVECLDLEPSRWIRDVSRTRPDLDLAVSLDGALSSWFTNNADIAHRCIDARLVGENDSVIGVRPGGALEHLGLESGDRKLQLCQDDASASNFGQCFPIFTHEDLGSALLSLLPSQNLLIKLQRGNNPYAIGVEIN